MRCGLLHKLAASVLLIVFLGGNFDFFAMTAHAPKKTLAAKHDYKCYLTFLSFDLKKCPLHEIFALASNPPEDNDWPNEQVFFLTGLFVPAVFHPPET
jgi:hypothetical protein